MYVYHRTHFLMLFVSKICWFPVKELPVSSMPGRDFFLVRPFVKQLNEWIKSRKSGKLRVSKQLINSKMQPKTKESRRTASVPTQRPERQFSAECVRQYSEGHNTLAELGRSGSFSVEDMFRVNEERFGVKSTYQAAMYTTPLPAGNSIRSLHRNVQNLQTLYLLEGSIVNALSKTRMWPAQAQAATKKPVMKAPTPQTPHHRTDRLRRHPSQRHRGKLHIQRSFRRRLQTVVFHHPPPVSLLWRSMARVHLLQLKLREHR